MGQVAGIFIVYAILLILGGAMGFAKAKSKASLISGIVTGLISLAIALVSKYTTPTALVLGIILAIGLGVFFMRRYALTKKPMPSLFMAVMSFVVALGAIIISTLRQGL